MNTLFALNRERLVAKLQGGLVVVAAYTSMQRGNDIPASFEQEANFWWLTGIDEPDWWLIIDGVRSKSWLVMPAGFLDGEYTGGVTPDQAKATSGVDDVLSRDKGMSLLRDEAKKHSVAYTLGDQGHREYLGFSLNPAPKKMHELLGRTFNAVRDCRKELAQLRAIKQPEEITRIKKAATVMTAAFEYMASGMEMFTHEYELEAELSYYLRRHGAVQASAPAVAAGKNACWLNYSSNASKLKKRDLVLVNASYRLQGYVADITRMYAYGEPTRRQLVVYETLRAAHCQIIELLGPNIAIDQYQRQVDTIMRAALTQLDLLSSTDTNDTMYRTYVPHAISHGLGVDVHDSLGVPRFLQPGMVLSVEPGIYIQAEGIGVRLEDTILITDSGYTNLSARLSTDL